MTQQPLGHPRLIAIVGGSGSGKTWLFRELMLRLGNEAAGLCLDDFYLDHGDLPLARRTRLNFDHPRALDWKRLEEVLLACRAGQSCEVPRYDFKDHARCGSGRPWQPKPLVLVEGLWLLRRKSIRQLFSASIFIECPEQVRLDRRIRRDTVERGRKESEVRRQFRDQVLPMHRTYVAPQQRWATVVVQSPMTASAVEILAKQIQETVQAQDGAVAPGRVARKAGVRLWAQARELAQPAQERRADSARLRTKGFVDL